MIRIIDSHYNTLFTLNDGEKLKIIFPDNYELIYPVYEIDETHIKVGTVIYHIREFAEKMEYAKNKIVKYKEVELCC